jgi:hypothetical protein
MGHSSDLDILTILSEICELDIVQLIRNKNNWCSRQKTTEIRREPSKRGKTIRHTGSKVRRQPGGETLLHEACRKLESLVDKTSLFGCCVATSDNCSSDPLMHGIDPLPICDSAKTKKRH